MMQKALHYAVIGIGRRHVVTNAIIFLISFFFTSVELLPNQPRIVYHAVLAIHHRFTNDSCDSCYVFDSYVITYRFMAVSC